MAMFKHMVLIGLIGAQVIDAQQQHDYALTLTTRYGTLQLHEPVLIELVQSPAMQRLHNIWQYGATRYAHAHEPVYTRYEHSLGVLHLLRLFGASLEEQIDGLLHDVSHTVFSHVGDYVFKHRNPKTSYQDEIHEWFLAHTGIEAILAAHNFENACSKAAKKCHRCLEQDKPDLCADRIEYTLSGGVLDGLLTDIDVQDLLAHLHFKDHRWFFDDAIWAAKFAHVALRLCEHRWGNAWNMFTDHCACQLIMRALELGLVDKETIHFSCDDHVWSLLQSSDDAELMVWRKRLQQCEAAYTLVASDQPYDFCMAGKFTGTDPWVLIDGHYVRVSSLNEDFAADFVATKERIKRERFFKLT